MGRPHGALRVLVGARGQLWWGSFVSLVFTGVVLFPAFLSPAQDGFPLSTFPMFSRKMPDPSLVVTQVLAVFPDGERRALPPKLATGNEEVIQTLRMIHDQTYGGDERAKAFCRDIATRIEERASPPWKEAVAVEIARSHFDSVKYFEIGPEPIQRKTLQRCPVRP